MPTLSDRQIGFKGKDAGKATDKPRARRPSVHSPRLYGDLFSKPPAVDAMGSVDLQPHTIAPPPTQP